MEDTSAEIKVVQQKIWMSFPVEERLRRCAELFEIAKEFARKRAPVGLDEEGIKGFVFKEMYGFELPERDAK